MLVESEEDDRAAESVVIEARQPQWKNMPKRTTLTYSSEDALADDEQQLHVYYCKYSGRHVLTTTCDLRRAPKRRTDGASVLDTGKYMCKMNTREAGTKIIKCNNGTYEKQYRQNLGKLVVAYRSEPDGKLLYILPNALTADSMAEGPQGAGKAPVPPCIMAIGNDTTQISLDIDDRADKAEIMKISADNVRLSIIHGVSHEDANEELLEFVRGILGVRLSQLSVMRGESTRHKLVLVKAVAPATAFDKLQAHFEKHRK